MSKEKKKQQFNLIDEIILMPLSKTPGIQWKLIKGDKEYLYQEQKRKLSLFPFICLLENPKVKITIPGDKIKLYPALKLFSTISKKCQGNREKVIHEFMKILRHAAKETYGLETRAMLTASKIKKFYMELIEKIDKYGTKREKLL